MSVAVFLGGFGNDVASAGMVLGGFGNDVVVSVGLIRGEIGVVFSAGLILGGFGDDVVSAGMVLGGLDVVVSVGFFSADLVR